VHFDDDYGDYRCMGGLGPVGLGRILGPQVHLAVGLVGLSQLLIGGLGWVWVDEVDPRTTLWPTTAGVPLTWMKSVKDSCCCSKKKQQPCSNSVGDG